MPLGRDTRITIDAMLTQAGWTIQDRDAINLVPGRGVAIREFPLSSGEADYVLVIGDEAVGVVEAKKQGWTLTDVKEQSTHYRTGVPLQNTPIRFLRSPLPFSYEATGVETLFTNELEPEPRSRRVFHFHRPETLSTYLAQAPVGVSVTQNNVLRSRLRRMPTLPRVDLRTCQYEAITALEYSFARNDPRALVQMATGSGKTYMAVSSIYRLINFAGAKRVLFLVDRTNLALQTRRQFQQYTTPDNGRKFTDLYNVQHLQDNRFDSASVVCITTIQRLYSILTGTPLTNGEEEASLFEQANDELQEPPRRTVSYNPAVPIEYFDVIFIDECHRSIYAEWQPVLEYFDAFLVGLTATPENRVYAFFERNLVYEYGQAQAVADGVDVDYDVYRVHTQITQSGRRIEHGNMLWYRNKQTRELTYEPLTDDLLYEGRHLDRDAMTPDQIRTVITAYKDALFKELFPGRREVPKTLIFAKHDAHADDIVQMVREVFDRGNDFVQKITYRVTGAKPEKLINRFRASYNPRIVVTVDMISTGTDIKPLEVLFFMRPIKSRTFFEQMKGRGNRMMRDEEFRLVTPDGGSKVRYILLDAVGVTEGLKTDTPPLERKASVSLEALMERVAKGNYSDDNLLSLAGRLGRLVKRVTPDDYEKLQDLTGGTLQDVADGLLQAIDYDWQMVRAREISAQEDPHVSVVEEATLQLALEATEAFRLPEVCDLLLLLQRRDKQAIDDISLDRVIDQGFNEEQARQEVASFRALMEKNKHEIDLFELALHRPLGTSLTESVQSVARAIAIPTLGLDRAEINRVWRAYQKLEGARVRGAGARRLLTDIIALMRYTMQRETDNTVLLQPYQDMVNLRFQRWLTEQEHLCGQPFSAEQRWWLDRICQRVVTNLQCQESDLDGGAAYNKGGRIAAAQAFGGEQALLTIMRELNERLVV